MTSPRTEARAAAAERRAASASMVAFEPDMDAPPSAHTAVRRRPALPATPPARAENDNRRLEDAPAPKPRESAASPAPAPIAIDDRHSGPGWFGWMLAAVWFGLATGSPIAYWGLTPVLSQSPAFLAMLTACAVFPAVGLLMVVAAARDAAAVRAIAAQLATRPAATPDTDAGAWRIARAEAEDAALAVADLLARERTAATDLAAILKTQTDAAAQAARRQVGLMREASRLVGEETRAVEGALVDALAAVSQAGAGLRADTEAGEAVRVRLCGAIETAADTQRLLEETTGSALDAADTVRAAAQAAMEDARRAAEAMRAESEAARAAMHEALDGLDKTAERARANARAAAMDARPIETPHLPEARTNVRRAAPAAFLPETPSQRDDTLLRDLNLDWMQRTVSPGVDMIETMGLDLDDAIGEPQLTGIARRARLGAGARRRAVLEAAPDAVDLIGRVCERDERVRRAAAAFRRDPGFDAAAPMDHWPRDGALTRAYLLVDAALGG